MCNITKSGTRLSVGEGASYFYSFINKNGFPFFMLENLTLFLARRKGVSTHNGRNDGQGDFNMIYVLK
jgi:hypothetical protein